MNIKQPQEQRHLVLPVSTTGDIQRSFGFHAYASTIRLNRIGGALEHDAFQLVWNIYF